MSFADTWAVAGWGYAWFVFLSALAVIRGAEK